MPRYSKDLVLVSMSRLFLSATVRQYIDGYRALYISFCILCAFSDPEFIIMFAWPYGLAAAVAVILWTLLEYALGLHSSYRTIGQYTGYVAGLLPVIFVARMLLDFRKKYKVMEVRYALQQGMLLALVAALGIAVFFFFYTQHIHPEWLDYQLQDGIARLQAQEVAPKDIEQYKLDFQRTQQQGVIPALYYFLSTSIMITVMSVVLGMFMQKRLF